MLFDNELLFGLNKDYVKFATGHCVSGTQKFLIKK